MNGRTCCTPQREGLVAGTSGRGPVAAAPSQEFIALPGGEFLMGTDSTEGFPADGEGPARSVHLEPFAVAPATVTNGEFSAFVRATGYITQSEQGGSSFVFYLQVPSNLRAAARQHARTLPWWLDVRDACWQRPEGPGSQIRERMDHPVVHVSWHDAKAYCDWAGADLPTEAQWECAARGGLAGKRYPWGDDMPTQPPCNIWQGIFPNEPAQGWEPGTTTARSGEPNGHGLYNTAGNVWEWCEDWFHPEYHSMTAQAQPLQSAPTDRKSLRGGSFLCHDSYCNRYRVAARGSNTPESSASNIGFRVAQCR
jgi:formylglycine-generating enzyme